MWKFRHVNVTWSSFINRTSVELNWTAASESDWIFIFEWLIVYIRYLVCLFTKILWFKDLKLPWREELCNHDTHQIIWRVKSFLCKFILSFLLEWCHWCYEVIGRLRLWSCFEYKGRRGSKGSSQKLKMVIYSEVLIRTVSHSRGWRTNAVTFFCHHEMRLAFLTASDSRNTQYNMLWHINMGFWNLTYILSTCNIWQFK